MKISTIVNNAAVRVSMGFTDFLADLAVANNGTFRVRCGGLTRPAINILAWISKQPYRRWDYDKKFGIVQVDSVFGRYGSISFNADKCLKEAGIKNKDRNWLDEVLSEVQLYFCRVGFSNADYGIKWFTQMRSSQNNTMILECTFVWDILVLLMWGCGLVKCEELDTFGKIKKVESTGENGGITLEIHSFHPNVQTRLKEKNASQKPIKRSAKKSVTKKRSSKK